MKHTKGPWIINEHAEIQAGTSILGKVYIGDCYPSGEEELDANAQLIASAPETAEERDRLKEEVEYLRTFSNAGVLASNDKGRKIVKLKEINSELLRALRIFIEPTTKRIYNVF